MPQIQICPILDNTLETNKYIFISAIHKHLLAWPKTFSVTHTDLVCVQYMNKQPLYVHAGRLQILCVFFKPTYKVHMGHKKSTDGYIAY